MKPFNRVLIFCLFILPVAKISAQDFVAQQRQEVFNAYRYDDTNRWEKARKALYDQWVGNGRPTNELLLELVITEYGLLSACQQAGDCEDFDERLNRANQFVSRLKRSSTYRGLATSLEGGLIAQRINHEPWTGISLAASSFEKIQEGVELAPQRPEVWIELGNFQAHAPSLFGGDKGGAMQSYQKAIALFEQQPTAQRNSWLYLHALASLGQLQDGEGDRYAARVTFEKALRIAPGFKLVQHTLLPGLSR